jgi:ATP-dependent helicase/nuclease subunit A
MLVSINRFAVFSPPTRSTVSDSRWTNEQRELIELTVEGRPRIERVAVAADAGAGKTSVLVERVKRLSPELLAGRRVLCVSFTEKSKADLEERLSELLHCEVYTIHGFCLRVVSEFGARIDLPPVFRILSKDETDDLFHKAFEKTYRRNPPANVEHGVETFFKLCQAAHEIDGEVRVHDCATNDEGLKSFVEEVLGEFENAKRMARALEYADLERFAVELIRRDDVTALLRSRYAHVFVDEFQDTSEIQCALVERLAGARGPLFVVGDSKQSIYRFRGADVRVFEAFARSLPAQKRLSANFRSHADVIDAVNAVCTPIIENYQDMQARRIEPASRPSPWAGDGAKLSRVARVTCETDADGIVAILQRMRAEGVDWSQVVLLLRRIKGNEELFAELARRGIAIAATSSAKASADEGLSRLVNLWIWACEPWQRLRAARVLTDFGGVSRAELPEKLMSDSIPDFQPLQTCEELLDRLEKRFALENKLGATYEQFRAFVLRHQSEGLSPAALARRLDRLIANDQDIDGFTLLPPPSNLSGTVRAMTVHSAKGLEFPVVILADVKNRRSRSFAHVRQGQDLWLPARDDKGDLIKGVSPLKEAIEAETKANTEESARLLYVAMTRAREALYVVDRPEPQAGSEEAEKKRTAKPELSWSAWLKAGILKIVPSEIFAGKSEPISAAGKASMPTEKREALESEAPEYLRARLGLTELGALLKLKTKPLHSNPTVSRPNKQRPEVSAARAAEIGTHIHGILENRDWEALRATEKKEKLDFSPFWSWLKTESARQVFEAARAYPEFAFEWRRGTTTVTGRIDLLIESEDEYWIVDYKILFGKRSALDLLASYSDQMRLYVEAVKILTNQANVRAFLLDVTAATGTVWHELDCTTK